MRIERVLFIFCNSTDWQLCLLFLCHILPIRSFLLASKFFVLPNCYFIFLLCLLLLFSHLLLAELNVLHSNLLLGCNSTRTILNCSQHCPQFFHLNYFCWAFWLLINSGLWNWMLKTTVSVCIPLSYNLQNKNINLLYFSILMNSSVSQDKN